MILFSYVKKLKIKVFAAFMIYLNCQQSKTYKKRRTMSSYLFEFGPHKITITDINDNDEKGNDIIGHITWWSYELIKRVISGEIIYDEYNNRFLAIKNNDKKYTLCVESNVGQKPNVYVSMLYGQCTLTSI